MNPFRSNVGTLNEILFEKRNKSYGAYAIRTAYGSTVFKSLGITSLAMIAIFGTLSFMMGKEVEAIIPDTGDVKIITCILDLEKPKAEKPTVEINKSDSNHLKSTVINKFDNNNKSTLTTTGGSTLTPGGGETAPTFFPEEYPSFPGLKKFWMDNLKYPRDARDNGIEGKVAVNFVLDEEGKIMSATIIKKLGFGCDDEVLRVIKLMPNWKPGKMGGKPVKVSFNQVVDFKLQ